MRWRLGGGNYKSVTYR